MSDGLRRLISEFPQLQFVAAVVDGANEWWDFELQGRVIRVSSDEADARSTHDRLLNECAAANSRGEEQERARHAEETIAIVDAHIRHARGDLLERLDTLHTRLKRERGADVAQAVCADLSDMRQLVASVEADELVQKYRAHVEAEREHAVATRRLQQAIDRLETISSSVAPLCLCVAAMPCMSIVREGPDRGREFYKCGTCAVSKKSTRTREETARSSCWFWKDYVEDLQRQPLHANGERGKFEAEQRVRGQRARAEVDDARSVVRAAAERERNVLSALIAASQRERCDALEQRAGNMRELVCAALSAAYAVVEGGQVQVRSKRTGGGTCERVKAAYALVGVPPTATVQAIQSAWRHQALRYHSDKNSDSGAQATFLKVQEAVDLVLDIARRRPPKRSPDEAVSRPSDDPKRAHKKPARRSASDVLPRARSSPTPAR